MLVLFLASERNGDAELALAFSEVYDVEASDCWCVEDCVRPPKGHQDEKLLLLLSVLLLAALRLAGAEAASAAEAQRGQVSWSSSGQYDALRRSRCARRRG